VHHARCRLLWVWTSRGLKSWGGGGSCNFCDRSYPTEIMGAQNVIFVFKFFK